MLVELKARFDERNNIQWATRLEEAGVHVVYGVENLKTHCKLCLVVRQEADGVRRYAHIGTGNYNRATSQVYTDLGLFTADPAVLDDVSEIFNYLTGYSQRTQYQPDAGRAGQPALAVRGAASTRDGARAGRPAGPRDHQEQRGDRSRHRARALSCGAGGRRDRHDRARRLLLAAGHRRHQRAHPRALGGRPFPGALAHLLLRERRPARGVPRQRRPDGAESRSARRDALSRARTRASRATFATSCSRPTCATPTAPTS